MKNKPDPSPKWFGYHEIWHVAVIVGCACFYVATMLVVLSDS
jgi:hemolysin III